MTEADGDGVRILLGVSGGIAAYKAAEIVRELTKRGAKCRVVMTARAGEFVTPLSLATLSGHPVVTTEFHEEPQPQIGHIELARWADVLAVAPATANVLARFGRGLADDLLSTLYLAFDGPVVVAPAMNPRMWDHAETRENVARLAHRGVTLIEPEEGLMACGDEGSGRLAPVEAIVEAIVRAGSTARSLADLRVVVTAGPTHEPIDAVRYVGNRSSGKMGFATAAAARARGAAVTLVSGPVALAPPFGVVVVRTETAEEMRIASLEAVFGAAPADVVVMSAAVADHRPRRATGKLAHKGETMTLELEPTPDILSEIVARRLPGQVIVGFAAETGDVLTQGRVKLERKGCDLLVVNDVMQAGAGFGVDTNIVTLLSKSGESESWPRLAKREVAERLLDRVCASLAALRR